MNQIKNLTSYEERKAQLLRKMCAKLMKMGMTYEASVEQVIMDMKAAGSITPESWIRLVLNQ